MAAIFLDNIEIEGVTTFDVQSSCHRVRVFPCRGLRGVVYRGPASRGEK